MGWNSEADVLAWSAGRLANSLNGLAGLLSQSDERSLWQRFGQLRAALPVHAQRDLEGLEGVAERLVTAAVDRGVFEPQIDDGYALRFICGLVMLDRAVQQEPKRRLLRAAQFVLLHADDHPIHTLLELAVAPDPFVRLEAAEADRTPLLGDFSSAAARSGVVSGRVVAVRGHRATTFVDLSTGDGLVQLLLDASQSIDVRTGDSLAVEGPMVPTRTSEAVQVVAVLAHVPRTTAPLAPGVLRAAAGQAALLRGVREVLDRRAFAEQLTSTLSPGFEGGRAAPFEVWEEYRRRPAYLRVSSELNLLQSLAAGLPRAYELGYSYRNGARGNVAHAEFLLLELYAVDVDLAGMLDLTIEICRAGLGQPDLPLSVMTCREAFDRYCGTDLDDLGQLLKLAQHHHLAVPEVVRVQPLIQRLIDNVVAPACADLLALSDIPLPSSPLTAGEDLDARRYWVYSGGLEVAEVAANEMDLRTMQKRLEAQFGQDLHALPRDYTQLLRALGSGMPPVSGTGIGISRLLGSRESGLPDSHII